MNHPHYGDIVTPLKPRVLFSQRSLEDPTNPYSKLLFSHLHSRVDVVPFSWKNALLGTFDIFHLQWPEYMVREQSVHRRVLNYLLCHALVVRLRLRRTPVVETVHNLRPHDAASALERRSVLSLRRLVGKKIYLNNSTENDLSSGSVILHGEYSPALSGLTETGHAPSSTYFLFFGLIRPYKGMEGLVKAFGGYDGPVSNLVIAGQPADNEYRRAVEALVHEDSRIILDLRHVPEAELYDLVANAEAVVLPYHYMYNSGALLYALSVGTPVLVPESPANESIQDEVGDEWVTMFSDEISATALSRAAISRSKVPKGSRPDLSARSWEAVAEKHLEFYAGVGKI